MLLVIQLLLSFLCARKGKWGGKVLGCALEQMRWKRPCHHLNSALSNAVSLRGGLGFHDRLWEIEFPLELREEYLLDTAPYLHLVSFSNCLCAISHSPCLLSQFLCSSDLSCSLHLSLGSSCKDKMVAFARHVVPLLVLHFLSSSSKQGASSAAKWLDQAACRLCKPTYLCFQQTQWTAGETSCPEIIPALYPLKLPQMGPTGKCRFVLWCHTEVPARLYEVTY